MPCYRVVKKPTYLELLYAVDLRGSDVRLETSTVLNATRQTMPYPAFGWSWEVVQKYKWASTQHINVFELIACFNYFRAVACRKGFSSQRIIHIVDSMVAAAVITKGRSSSKVLNRTLRRICAVVVAADIYVLPLWTLSDWNFADAGSRMYRPPT